MLLNDEFNEGFIDEELIIITKQTLEKLIKSEKGVDALGLYLYYYSVAKWQRTNQIFCTTSFAAQALNWGERKVQNIKKELINMNLIEDVVTKDENNKIIGHYVRVKYIFTHKNETAILDSHPVEKATPQKSHPVEKATPWKKPPHGKSHPVENSRPNALSNNNKMLKVENINALSKKEKCLSCEEVANLFNEICISLPKVLKLTDARKQSIRNASKIIDDDFKGLFTKVEQSDFLTGKNGAWRGACFDWCLKKANLIKIMEGNYDNRNAAGYAAVGTTDPYAEAKAELEQDIF